MRNNDRDVDGALRFTQWRKWVQSHSRVTVLRTSFDEGNEDYLRHILAEIRSTGKFVSGIDVEPSINNSLHYVTKNGPKELQTRAAIQQRLYEQERARIRAEQDRRIKEEWPEDEL